MIVTILSSTLEKLIAINEKAFQGDIPRVAVCFDSCTKPDINILQYLSRMQKYSECHESCFVIALILVDRLIASKRFFLSCYNVHRIILTSVMLAIKVYEDTYYNNAFYARLGGVSTSELQNLEVELLKLLDFRLFVNVDCYTRYFNQLKSQIGSFAPGVQYSMPVVSMESTVHISTAIPHYKFHNTSWINNAFSNNVNGLSFTPAQSPALQVGIVGNAFHSSPALSDLDVESNNAHAMDCEVFGFAYPMAEPPMIQPPPVPVTTTPAMSPFQSFQAALQSPSTAQTFTNQNLNPQNLIALTNYQTPPVVGVVNHSLPQENHQFVDHFNFVHQQLYTQQQSLCHSQQHRSQLLHPQHNHFAYGINVQQHQQQQQHHHQQSLQHHQQGQGYAGAFYYNGMSVPRMNSQKHSVDPSPRAVHNLRNDGGFWDDNYVSGKKYFQSQPVLCSLK